MALFFCPPSSSPASIPSCSIFFGKPVSCPASYLPSAKRSRTFPLLLFSEQISSFRCPCTLKAPIFTSSPPSPSLSCIKASSCPTSTGFYCSATSGDRGLDADQGEDEDEGSPWEGAVVYRRDASMAHLEYCTTLERLGLGKLSTDLSKSRASAMGIRLVSTRKGAAVGDPSFSGTPVLVSVDVTRKKRKLKLDGIVRTVITLGCNRCGEPAAESVFSNFTLLLTEKPIEEELEGINMGVIYGEDKKARSVSPAEGGEDDEDERWIDLDDRLYFPAEEEEVDISKHIRDMVHVEITINAVCDARCKGLCFRCGTNLNKSGCRCHEGDAEQRTAYGPLGGLKKQMQRT